MGQLPIRLEMRPGWYNRRLDRVTRAGVPRRVAGQGGRTAVAILAQILDRFGIAGELLHFLWQRKLWWLMPMVLMLLVIGLLVLFVQATAISPFLYPLF
jgi:hypothetical protein